MLNWQSEKCADGGITDMKVLMISDIYTHPHNQGNLQGGYRECLKMKELGWEVDYLYWGNYHRADLNAMRAFF